MELVNINRGELIEYVTKQINHFFPDNYSGDVHGIIGSSMDMALDRMRPNVKLAKLWPKDKFYYLHSNQYAVFLYYLANSIWRFQQNENVCSKLFYLNKALNGFECFYEINLPDIFYITHSPGIVLARATYANYFVLYQNTTVGRVHVDQVPVFEEGVVLYPNSVVIGKCHVRAKSFISQGQSLIDADTPGDCLVFSNNGKYEFKKPKFDVMNYFFRLEE
jgi:serine O-acetyltransferase